MKKIFALALAIVMMMAIALPTFAAVDTVKYGDVDGTDADATQIYSDNMKLEYGVAQTYTVTIPADISFNSNTLKETRDVTISDAVIAGNEKIKVEVTSKHGWKMVDYQDGTVESVTAQTAGPSDAVDYWYGIDEEVSFAYGATQFAGTGPIIDEEAADGNKGLVGRSKTVTLHFGTRGTAQEGTYKDFLTFKVEVYVPQTNG